MKLLGTLYTLVSIAGIAWNIYYGMTHEGALVGPRPLRRRSRLARVLRLGLGVLVLLAIATLIVTFTFTVAREMLDNS